MDTIVVKGQAINKMFLLSTEDTIFGIFTTKEKANEAKIKIAEEEIARWLDEDCGTSEILAEASDKERQEYLSGKIKIKEIKCYKKFYYDWLDCYHICELELDKITQINLV